jgi:putative transcriptional regulator
MHDSGQIGQGWGDPSLRRLAVGRLLVATPSLTDPNFARTVVLILQHDGEDGTMGIVLNRPTGLTVDDHLDGWGVVAPAPDRVYIGGPVHPELAIVAATCPAAASAPVGVEPWPDEIVQLTDFAGVVDLTLDPSLLVGRVVVRVFAGHAGWSPGQLDEEIAQDAWWVVDSEQDDLVTRDPEGLWRRVLRRQRGPLALVSSFPDEPERN